MSFNMYGLLTVMIGLKRARLIMLKKEFKQINILLMFIVIKYVSIVKVLEL